MFQRDMRMVRWRQSIYAVEPHMMYGLSVIRPISCQPVNDRIVVKICYPVVKKSNMYSLFEVKHRGAFNADSTVFGYANIADHIAVPLHDESGRNVDSVENVDLARCELKFGSVWTCRGLVSDHYKYCGLDGIVNCTWQLMPVKDHGFVYTRVIGDRTVTEDGQKEKVPSNIFELKLSNEVAIIGSEHLSPISTVTNVKSDFLTPTLSVLYEHFFDDDDKADVQKMVALTHDASEAGRKFSIASDQAKEVSGNFLSFFDFDWLKKLFAYWKEILIAVVVIVIIIGLLMCSSFFMSASGCSCHRSSKSKELKISVGVPDKNDAVDV